jgi:hypothetical protein
MRRVSTIIGLAVAVCAFGMLATSAFAALTPTVFGEFTASIPGSTISPASPAKFASKEAESEELKLAGTPIECERLKGSGETTAERSSSLTILMKFSKCTYTDKEPGGRIVKHKLGFKLPVTFHSNGSAELGGEVSEEVGPASVGIKSSDTPCVITIPQQQVPIKVKPEGAEAAEYSSEFESVEGKKKEELFPLGQERLEVDMEFKNIQTTVHTEPGKCEYSKEEASKFNKETSNIEYGGGILEAELDEINIKKGNIGFEEPAV